MEKTRKTVKKNPTVHIVRNCHGCNLSKFKLDPTVQTLKSVWNVHHYKIVACANQIRPGFIFVHEQPKRRPLIEEIFCGVMCYVLKHLPAKFGPISRCSSPSCRDRTGPTSWLHGFRPALASRHHRFIELTVTKLRHHLSGPPYVGIVAPSLHQIDVNHVASSPHRADLHRHRRLTDSGPCRHHLAVTWSSRHVICIVSSPCQADLLMFDISAMRLKSSDVGTCPSYGGWSAHYSCRIDQRWGWNLLLPPKGQHASPYYPSVRRKIKPFHDLAGIHTP